MGQKVDKIFVQILHSDSPLHKLRFGTKCGGSSVPRGTLHMIGYDWRVMHSQLCYHFELAMRVRILKGLSEHRIKRFLVCSFKVIPENHAINSYYCEPPDWILLCYCFVQQVKVLACSCLHLEGTHRHVKVYRQTDLGQILADGIFDHGPHTELNLRVFKEWEPIPLGWVRIFPQSQLPNH